MIKAVGLALIALAGAGLGWYASAALGRRVRDLEAALRLVDAAASRIRYEASPIGELLGRIADGGGWAAPDYVREAASRIRGGEPPQSAWTHALEDSDCGLNSGDREVIVHFGGGLGKSDVEGQLAHCGAFRDMLSRRADEARAESHTKGKLYFTLGVVGGIGLAILFI